MNNCFSRYSRTVTRLVLERKASFVLLLLLFGVAWIWLSSSTSRDGVMEDVRVEESAGWKENLIGVAKQLKEQRSRDLTRLLKMRRRSLKEIQEEVNALSKLVRNEEDVFVAKTSKPKAVVLREDVTPPIIHMTWKSKSDMPLWGKRNIRLWKRLNPKHKLILYDDTDIETVVKKSFPQIIPFWKALKPVQRADIFRYVVIWEEGGVYADLDVEPVKPIDSWMINCTKDTVHWKSANVLLGWEKISDRKDWQVWFASQHQLCQWTFASSPKHDLWKKVMDHILAYFKAGTTNLFFFIFFFIIIFVQGKHLKSKSIIRSTGPGMFSEAVKDFLQIRYGAVIGQTPLDTATLMQKNVHLGDVLLLSQSAFAEDVWDWESPKSQALVRHEFQGTWKTVEKEGEKNEDLDVLDTERGRMEHQMVISVSC